MLLFQCLLCIIILLIFQCLLCIIILLLLFHCLICNIILLRTLITLLLISIFITVRIWMFIMAIWNAVNHQSTWIVNKIFKPAYTSFEVLRVQSLWKWWWDILLWTVKKSENILIITSNYPEIFASFGVSHYSLCGFLVEIQHLKKGIFLFL